MMDWTGRKVVIIGAARQGLALARYLVGHGAGVLLNDRKPVAELQEARAGLGDLPADSLEWVVGDHPLEVLKGADLVCPSGGVPLDLPLVLEAQRRGIPLSNDSQIFLEAAPCRVIGITGSAGKTTTTTLVGRMAAAARKSGTATGSRVWVGGNLGTPLIAYVDEMRPDDLTVMELSSFQLELVTRSPHIAAVLNITPNHLDRHASMQAYAQAKARILEFQDSGRNGDDWVAVLNRDDPGSWELVEKVRGRLVTFGLEDPGPDLAGTYLNTDMLWFREQQAAWAALPRSAIGLRGTHNLMNVLAACAIAAAAGFPAGAMQAGVDGFRGVAHRLELVYFSNGVSWYNDSIATAPERAIAAIRSFDEPLILLAGGRDKNLPWDEFAAEARLRVGHLILFGEAAGKIEGYLQAEREATGHDWPYSVDRCPSLQQAVQQAARIAQPGSVVLLAPGGTSFDEFQDFEDRGEAFRRWVKQIHNHSRRQGG
jgi:UDP-N-acetylmuramoylalanine--D-glutamate ligase